MRPRYWLISTLMVAWLLVGLQGCAALVCGAGCGVVGGRTLLLKHPQATPVATSTPETGKGQNNQNQPQHR